MSEPIDIVAVGMVTAVGLDATSSCAAMRAGLDGFQETRFAGPGGDWLVGAPVPLPRQWVGEKRMAHLAAGAVTEIFEQVPEARGNCTVILCLAEEDRPGRPVRDAARLLRKISEIVKVPASSSARVVNHGRPSGHVALEQSRRLLGRGEAEYVLILGVDSYLTARSVGHYIDQSRLLTADNPNGFIPGEAAAAILCARPGKRGLRLHGLGLSREPAYIYNAEDLPLRGDGMAAAYRSALSEAGVGLHKIAYRISDLIGESYFFKQTALVIQRLMRERVEFQDLWSPGENLGNVGAAVVPMMIGMHFMADRKGYAMGNSVLVEASNDSGACGGAVLGRAA